MTTRAQLNAEQPVPLFHWLEHGVELVFASEPANFARVTSSIRDANFKKQMLLTSHNTTLMDVEVLRRDEI